MILLDTHVWVWWAAEPKKLSARARKAVESAEEIGVSAISPWETALRLRAPLVTADVRLRRLASLNTIW